MTTAAAVAACVLANLSLAGQVWAQELKPIALPKPDLKGGLPLMQALQARRTSREFSPEPLPLPELSGLLWAAFGVNRPQSGGRTAPSARDWQETDVYVARADGLYLYDAQSQALKVVLAKDIRAATGRQAFVAQAPVSLVYVADTARMGKATEQEKGFYPAADAGFIAENVYLYCASRGLAVGVRGSIDRPALAQAMGLRPEQKIMLAQSVGFPTKPEPGSDTKR